MKSDHFTLSYDCFQLKKEKISEDDAVPAKKRSILPKLKSKFVF